MLGFFALAGAMLSGYAGVPPYAIAVAAIAMASISYAEHGHLYQRGRELGLTTIINNTLLRSLINGVVASAMAYLGGWVLRIL